MSDTFYKLFVVALYLAVLLYIGHLASRRVKNVRDYFAGGKSMGFWSVAFSARATGESAWLLLGLTGMGAAYGMNAMWVVVGEVVGVGGAWLLLSRRFKRLTDRYDSLTIPDYLESRFRDSSHLLRIASAGALVVFVTIYVSAQIDATGVAFETFLGWNYYLGIAIGFAVVLTYIVSGGFVAVVWSDVFQGALMGIGLVVLPLTALAAAGGPGVVMDGLAAHDASLLSFSIGDDLLSLCWTLSLLLIGLGFFGSPQIFVRFIALRNENEIGRGAAVAIVWTLLADTGAVMTGMVGRFMLTEPGQAIDGVLGSGAQDVLPMLVSHVMPILLVGLYVAIVLSAIMSTIDSLLVVASSAVVRDWYQRVKAPDTSDDALVPMSRRATIGLAVISLAIALTVSAVSEQRTIFWFVIFGWSGISATFCPTMILSLFWRSFTRRGALSAMAVGFFGVPFFKFVAPTFGGEAGQVFEKLSELPPAFALSLVAGVVVSLTDRAGRARLRDVDEELTDAAR